MGRKAKDPEIRRMELILAAEKLFKEKGFEDTSVSDITDAVGVSHGTFFYYFESKNEILKAVIDYYVGKDRELLEGILKNDSLSGLKKVQALLDITCLPKEESPNRENKLVEYLHMEGNESLHTMYVRRSQTVVIPLVTEMVEQGVREGAFDVKYPKETVEYIINMFDDIQHEIRDIPRSNEEYYRKVRALEVIITRVFGAKEGSLSIMS